MYFIYRKQIYIYSISTAGYNEVGLWTSNAYFEKHFKKKKRAKEKKINMQTCG